MLVRSARKRLILTVKDSEGAKLADRSDFKPSTHVFLVELLSARRVIV